MGLPLSGENAVHRQHRVLAHCVWEMSGIFERPLSGFSERMSYCGFILRRYFHLERQKQQEFQRASSGIHENISPDVLNNKHKLLRTVQAHL